MALLGIHQGNGITHHLIHTAHPHTQPPPTKINLKHGNLHQLQHYCYLLHARLCFHKLPHPPHQHVPFSSISIWEGLGEGGLKELGFGGEVKYKYSVGVRVEEEGHVPWMLGESWSSSNESFKVFRCGYGKSLNSLLLLCVFHLKLHVFISLSI